MNSAISFSFSDKISGFGALADLEPSLLYREVLKGETSMIVKLKLNT